MTGMYFSPNLLEAWAGIAVLASDPIRWHGNDIGEPPP